MKIITIIITASAVALLFSTQAIATSATCPTNMVLVQGQFCPKVEQICEVWKDTPCDANHQPAGCQFARCQKFHPTICKSQQTIAKSFCIDADEYTPSNQSTPLVDVNYYQAQVICHKNGKRLCKETEWELACEGPSISPYPTGLERPTNQCNIDIEGLDVLVNYRCDNVDTTHMSTKEIQQGCMNNFSVASAALTQCVSVYGVRNQSGNVDELTERDDSSGPYKNALKGGWWSALRNRCRPATTFHDDNFHEVQIGFRCCKDT